MESGFVAKRGQGVCERHVEVDNGGNPRGARHPQGLAHRFERYLGNLRRKPCAATDELRVIRADVARRGLQRGSRSHVDRSAAVIGYENLGQGRRRFSQHQVALDPVAIHRRAQETTRFVVPLPSRDARSKTQGRGPAQLVEHHSANSERDRPSVVDIAQDGLLLGAENARRAVNAIQRHAADSDEIEVTQHPLLFRRPREPTVYSMPS